MVPNQPPDPVPEEPPDARPQGDNVQWIPGYWAWDPIKKGWLWVSGTWRVPPPDRKWVPGYWAKTQEGWQWVPGFWASASEAELPYRESVPRSLENGPSAPAPDDNSIYVPGIWIPRANGSAWRPGYWLGCEADWTWNASGYSWTPRGYVYVDGYWDYPIENRGFLFAPVQFDLPLGQTPDWRFQPQYGVGIDGLLGNLFVGPGGGYFFGNYYGPGYQRAGWQPWFAFGLRNHDPLFGHYRWSNRNHPGWYAGLRGRYWGVRQGTVAAPAATLATQSAASQQSVVGKPSQAGAGNGSKATAAVLVQPLAQLSSGPLQPTQVGPAKSAKPPVVLKAERATSQGGESVSQGTIPALGSFSSSPIIGSPGALSRSAGPVMSTLAPGRVAPAMNSPRLSAPPGYAPPSPFLGGRGSPPSGGGNRGSMGQPGRR
jgi:hypothetical protein